MISKSNLFFSVFDISIIILENANDNANVFQFQDAVTGDSSSTHVTAVPVLNDGPLASDRDVFIDDDVGSGLEIEGSSGSGWGPGVDDEDARGSGDDLPEDDEDYDPRTTTTTTLPTPTLEPDDYHDSYIPSSSISPVYFNVSCE